MAHLRELVNSAHASKDLRDAMRSARSPLAGIAPGLPRHVPGAMNEVHRQIEQQQQERIQALGAKKHKGISRAGSKVFISFGLYTMRNEIKGPLVDLTTCTDRTC